MKRAQLRQIHTRTKMRTRKKRRRSISRRGLATVLFLCLATAILLNRTAAAGEDDAFTVVLKADDITIKQGENIPEFTARAECTGDTDVKLNTESGYSIQDLLDELNRGEGYTISCETDGSQEGTYEIRTELTSELTTPLFSEWFGKIRLETESGYLTVMNPYGEWDGSKFKHWKGNYAANEFITYHGNTYYFDVNGTMTTGWKTVNGSRYYFTKKGVMKTGWMKKKDAVYYFADNGIMSTGWKTIDEDKYYFDKKGRMVTGEKKIGTRECVFAEDGKLQSMKGGVNPDRPMIALTFDDGPGTRTGELVDALKKNNARATFFVLGMNAVNYQDTLKKMQDAECEIGNHSYNHPQLTSLDEDGIKKQLGDTNQMISNAVGQNATVMRPTYGVVNDNVKAYAQMPMILWSVDTLDWKNRDKDTIINSVLSTAGDGDIILMHDIYGTTIDAVIELIPKLIERGYQVVTVSEMAEARGIQMENGVVYSSFWK